MFALYCALICQHIVWTNPPISNITWCGYDHQASHVMALSKTTDGFDPVHELDMKTWGATLKECKPLTASQILTEISYFIDFDGDGGVCNK